MNSLYLYQQQKKLSVEGLISLITIRVRFYDLMSFAKEQGIVKRPYYARYPDISSYREYISSSFSPRIAEWIRKQAGLDSYFADKRSFVIPFPASSYKEDVFFFRENYPITTYRVYLYASKTGEECSNAFWLKTSFFFDNSDMLRPQIPEKILSLVENIKKRMLNEPKYRK